MARPAAQAKSGLSISWLTGVRPRQLRVSMALFQEVRDRRDQKFWMGWLGNNRRVAARAVHLWVARVQEIRDRTLGQTLTKLRAIVRAQRVIKHGRGKAIGLSGRQGRGQRPSRCDLRAGLFKSRRDIKCDHGIVLNNEDFPTV